MSSNLQFLPTAPNDPNREWKIDHAGRIHKREWIVSLGVLTGLAFLVALTRLGLRLKFRRKLLLDDVFVLFGIIALALAIGYITHYYKTLFKTEALNTDPTVQFSYEEAYPMLDAPKIIFTYLAFIWTSIFCIKFSFLVFFRSLIRNVSKTLDVYFWVVIVFSVVAWILAICMPFILCPYFKPEQILAKCYPNSPFAQYFGLTILVAVMDIISDLMVISIPIFILRMTRLRTTQKFGIALFLCLSVAMIVVCIIRVSGMMYKSLRSDRDIDPSWSVYWTHVEGCIAVFMGSVTAFRGIFGDFLQERSKHSSHSSSASTDSLVNRLRVWLGFSAPGAAPHVADQEVDNKGIGFNEESLTKVTLHEFRAFVRRYGRGYGDMSLGSMAEDGGMDYDPLNEYHVFQRQHGGLGKPIPVYMAPKSPNGDTCVGSSVGAKSVSSCESV